MSSCEEFAFGTLEGPAFLVAPSPAAPDPAAVLDVVGAARAEAEAIREQARAEGFEAGRAEALEALEPAVAAFAEAVRSSSAGARAAAVSLEGEAARLACALAEKVVAGALAVRPELVLDSIRGALRGILVRERVTVLVHPDDLALVRAGIDAVAAELGGVEHVDVQAERRIGSRGGAIVLHADGDLDARVETKLERAREVVEEALRS